MKTAYFKTIAATFIILVSAFFTFGQSISSQVEIVTSYSQNGKFYLKSTPFDNESPSLPGMTSVYQTGVAASLYTFERGFDEVDDNELILSNDGEVIFYLIGWDANEEKEGMKSITIYRHGEIVKSFTESEITGCDASKERCQILYSNYDEVVDREKSNFGSSQYKKAFKEGVDEKEKFLSDYAIFSDGDMVYLTDSKKRTHQFDLKTATYTGSESFDNLYGKIKTKGRFQNTKLQHFEAPSDADCQKLKDGRPTVTVLADALGMKPADMASTSDQQYKLYRFTMSGFISQDGSFQLEKLDADSELPKDKITEFFKTAKCDVRPILPQFAKWFTGDEYFYFRNKDARVAQLEKQQQNAKEREDLKKRLVAESIQGIYIPRNLEESFIELDKLLKDVDKKEMREKKNRDEMIAYHFGLGMWLRNNWGLWGGSRLQKYFTDRKIGHPDDMSSVILFYYYDWLNGKKETWKEWEGNPQQKLFSP